MSGQQPKLFEHKAEWENEWEGMPEFSQTDKRPIKEITVYFESKKDMKKFCELTGLSVSMKTMGIFFPKKEADRMVFVDNKGQNNES